MEMLTLIRDYGGLAVGALCLLVAAWVLPGRMKAYVLTAGLAILSYELYLKITNRARLKAADEERDRLRARANDLSKKGEALAQTVTELDARLAATKARQSELDRQDAGLAARGEALATQKEELRREAEQTLREIESHKVRQADLQSMRAELEDAKRALQLMGTPDTNGNPGSHGAGPAAQGSGT